MKTIKYTSVAVPAFLFLSNSNFYDTAITVSNPNTAHHPVSVYGNEINDCWIGEYANGILSSISTSGVTSIHTGLKIGMDAAGNYGNSFQNKISFSLGETPDPNTHYKGIWLQNCSNANVVSNEITNDMPVTGTVNFRGIDVEGSINCRINCNNITSLPWSMRFFADCDGTLLRSNSMTEYEEGIRLDGATLAHQYQVNDVTGDKEPTDNIWNDPPQPNGSPTDRVTGTISSIIPINWYYRPGTPGTNPYDPKDNLTTSLIIFAQLDAPGTVACDDISDRQGRDEKYGRTVGDSLQFTEYENENTWLAIMNAYTDMKKDSTIIHRGNSNDQEYQQFFVRVSESNIGRLAEVNELATDSGSIIAAQTINTAIIDTNSIEHYKKTVNDYYLNSIAKGVPLSAADSNALENFTSLSIYMAGDAIYQAAAMIGKEIHPAYTAMRKANAVSTENYIVSPFKVHPNPATLSFKMEGITDDIKEVVLINAGNQIIKQFQQPFPEEFSVAEIANGFYQLKLIHNNDSISFLKLSIAR